jgi:hypothetical protein
MNLGENRSAANLVYFTGFPARVGLRFCRVDFHGTPIFRFGQVPNPRGLFFHPCLDGDSLLDFLVLNAFQVNAANPSKANPVE